MTLTDTGPLIALIDAGQGVAHHRCVAARPALSAPLVTTWPCLTEAMYLLGNLRGWSGQLALWRFLEQDALRVHTATEGEWQRMRALMEQYRDTPMDLADASLVVAAETLNLRRIFTLDSDFYVYRLPGSHAFEVIP